ncbi:MAG TPA: MGMT family protein [Mycobacteriales bacterium]|nr:MGMT family protein [Mycobacteriales bacterium]
MNADRSRTALGDFACHVLDVVDLIPAGRVMSYRDVADYLGRGSARAVGSVLARNGAEVCWHRVVMADGRPAPHKDAEQLRRLRGDRTPLTGDGRRVDMARARWDGAGPVRPTERRPRMRG